MKQFSKDEQGLQSKEAQDGKTNIAQQELDGSNSIEQNKTSVSEEVIKNSEAEKGAIASELDEPYRLDRVDPLDPKDFPNPPQKEGSVIPATIPNYQHLLEKYGITVRYDTIKKKMQINVPGLHGSPDNAENSAFAHIESLANLNRIPTGDLPIFLVAIADRSLYNPAADWIMSKPWDGVDRLEDFYDTLTEQEEFLRPLKEVLMYKWALSAVAAALKPSGFYNRGVLTLQGNQGLGKTSWFKELVPDLTLQENIIKLGHHLDAGNKDSMLTAITHWIVEIGELDGSLRKDIAKLKGFLTNNVDKVRRPYGKGDSEYPRRTVFCSSVNDPNFLVDSTGNTRFWVIPVVKINYQHGIDMQQLFAQLAADFHKGEKWWLAPAEEKCLEIHNRGHIKISAVRERVLEALELERVGEPGLPAMSPSEVLRKIEIENPTNQQAKECAATLREFLGESKKINGIFKWRVPLKSALQGQGLRIREF